jgi:hypothetical protein
MTLPLHPESIAALYEYLRSMPPFRTLKGMPHADEVEFWVVKDRERFGWYQRIGGRPRISISSPSIGQIVTLIETLGHEMILECSGLETGTAASIPR